MTLEALCHSVSLSKNWKKDFFLGGNTCLSLIFHQDTYMRTINTFLKCELSDYILWFPFASSVGEIELILFQPHLQRTKLCDMEDHELDPLYLKKRDQLKEVVASMIKPKIVQGRTLNGTEFVSFLGQVMLLGEFITGTQYLDISLQKYYLKLSLFFRYLKL